MQSNQPKTIFLKDYKPSAFLIDSISLSVDIFDDKTIVKSSMNIFRSKENSAQGSSLELNGENITLKSVKINGTPLKNDDYQLSSDKLVILNVVLDEMVIEIEKKTKHFSN